MYTCLVLVIYPFKVVVLLKYKHIWFFSPYRLKDRFIILSVDGPDENVLKFKPPMCFSRDDAEFLLANLNEVLSEVETTRKTS